MLQTKRNYQNLKEEFVNLILSISSVSKQIMDTSQQKAIEDVYL